MIQSPRGFLFSMNQYCVFYVFWDISSLVSVRYITYYTTPFSTSDHDAVSFSVLFEQECTEYNLESDRYQYCWYDANFDDMISILQSINWPHVVYNNPSAECMWSVFSDILNHAIDATVPQYHVCARPHNKSAKHKYPRAIRKELCIKHRLWKKCKSQPGNHFLPRDALVHSAVLRLHVVRLSVRLSVMLVDQDHIGSKSWKLIARSIRPTPLLFVAQRPST